MTFQSNDLATIKAMHSYCRANNSIGESQFITRYIDSIPGMTEDGFGNRILQIGESPILFSCHTDTCHHLGTPARQYTEMDKKGILSVKGQKKGHCL